MRIRFRFNNWRQFVIFAVFCLLTLLLYLTYTNRFHKIYNVNAFTLRLHPKYWTRFYRTMVENVNINKTVDVGNTRQKVNMLNKRNGNDNNNNMIRFLSGISNRTIIENGSIDSTADMDNRRQDDNILNKTNGDDDMIRFVAKNKQKILSSVPINKWCKIYQKPNISFAPYMDKHAIKEMLPTLAPGLGFAQEYAFVDHGKEITEDLLKNLPHEYFMKGTAISGGVIKITGNSVTCLKGPCPKRLPNENLASYLGRVCDAISRINPWRNTGETAYKLIPKRCIFEEAFPLNSEFRDYKAWVFNGRVIFVHIDSGRFTKHRKNLRTPQWKEITGMRITGAGNGNGRVQLPDEIPPFYKQLIMDANQIGRRFKFARIDFFVFNNTHKFSEITQCHMACDFGIEPKILYHFFGYMLTHNLTVDPEFLLKLTNSA